MLKDFKHSFCNNKDIITGYFKKIIPSNNFLGVDYE